MQAWDRFAYVNNSPINYNDPSGHCLILCTAIIGAAIGAVVGAVGYTIYTAATGTEFNTGHMLLAAGGGAIAGALIGTGVGIAAGLSEAAAIPPAVTGAGIAEQTISGLGADGDPTNEIQTATQYARAMGQAGEAAANITKNTIKIDSLTQTANYRIPDGLDPAAFKLTEVKNVANLSYTNQIKDFVMWAQSQTVAYTIDLIVRQNTRFTGPLQQIINDGLINPIRILPPQ